MAPSTSGLLLPSPVPKQPGARLQAGAWDRPIETPLSLLVHPVTPQKKGKKHRACDQAGHRPPPMLEQTGPSRITGWATWLRAFPSTKVTQPGGTKTGSAYTFKHHVTCWFWALGRRAGKGGSATTTGSSTPQPGHTLPPPLAPPVWAAVWTVSPPRSIPTFVGRS